MNDRGEQELGMLRACYPTLEFQENGQWVRLANYPTNSLWASDEIEVAFQFPENLPGQEPYSFYVRPDLRLRDGTSPDNYTYPNTTPWGDDWGRFSWSLDPWIPRAELAEGSNMVQFVRSFAGRLGQGK
jgi:hypothetical protein